MRKSGLITSSSRLIPIELGMVGFFFRLERDAIRCRGFLNGDTGMIILYTRMGQTVRFQEDFGL